LPSLTVLGLPSFARGSDRALPGARSGAPLRGAAATAIAAVPAATLVLMFVFSVPMPVAAQLPAPAPGSKAMVPPAPSAREQVDDLIRGKKLDQALQRADAEIAKNPRDAQVRFLRAVILADLKKTPEAITAYESLTQEFPELPEPYNNLAVLHAAAGRYEVARSLLLRSIEAQGNYVTARDNLGDLYLAMAADAYTQALKLSPQDKDLQAKLALARDAAARLRAAR